jgi:hypothetical protein
MQQHLREVSLLTASGLTLVVILAVDLTLSLAHIVQEYRGRLWRYFGAVVGVKIPDAVGRLFFSYGLTAILWAVGFVGITGHLPNLRPIPRPCAMAAVGGLIGGRLSDVLHSHVGLHFLGFRPNPGLASTPYYFAEALILAILFLPGLWSNYQSAAIGFLAGWLFFHLILPVIWAFRIFPGLRRAPRWQATEPMPDWAQD